MDILTQLLQDVPLPKMVKVKQNFAVTEIADVAAETRKVISQSGAVEQIAKGDRVAIAVGSRGVADIDILTKEVVDAVKAAGGEPFIVPAMGSHGGATAAGQQNVLAQLNVTEATVGAPIIASMEVVKVGELPNGLPIYTDKHAYEADKVIVINRIKPHTAFRGPVESGLMKMITIGLGKQKGAEAAHLYGFKHMAEHVPEMAKIVLSKVPIIFGLGTIENAHDRPAKIVAIKGDQMMKEEPALLLEAKRFMPKIMVDDIDVLVVDEIGKDISGDGMDPNITGRYATPYATGGPNVKRIVVLNLTEKTHGNGNGIGIADITTKQAFESLDLKQGYANALTSTVVNTVRIPMILETNELAVKAAVKTCNTLDIKNVKIVRIKNTLELKEIWVSTGLLTEIEGKEEFEILSEIEDMVY